MHRTERKTYGIQKTSQITSTLLQPVFFITNYESANENNTQIENSVLNLINLKLDVNHMYLTKKILFAL